MSKRLTVNLFYALTICLLPGMLYAADSDPEAFKWLNKMTNAGRSLNYEGVFVYQHHNELEAMRIIHKVDGNGEHERLVSLNGAAREVIRDNKFVTCILPDDKTVIIDKSRLKTSFPVSFPDNFKALSNYYSFNLDARERVAAMMAQAISIKPKDKYRYGYRLWIDTASGLLLKSDQVNEKGVPMEQIMFTDLKVYKHIPDERLQPSVSGKEYTRFQGDNNTRKNMTPEKSWHVNRVPDGFSMSHFNKHQLPTSKMPVNHMVYTDGLAWVSVYIEKIDKNKDFLLGHSSMGSLNAYGKVLGQYYVTAVGEVPELTVRMMGDSVQDIKHLPETQ